MLLDVVLYYIGSTLTLWHFPHNVKRSLHHILNTSSLLVVYNSGFDDVTLAELLLVEALTVSTVIVYVNRLIWEQNYLPNCVLEST